MEAAYADSSVMQEERAGVCGVAIDRVTNQGVAYACHVRPYLVACAFVNVAPDKRCAKATQVLLACECCECLKRIARHVGQGLHAGVPQLVRTVARKHAGDTFVVRIQRRAHGHGVCNLSAGNGEVCLGRFSLVFGMKPESLPRGIEGHHDEARCGAVQSIEEAWHAGASCVVELPCKEGRQKRFDTGGGTASNGCRVQTTGFVDRSEAIA